MRLFYFEVDNLDDILAGMDEDAVILLGSLDMRQYIANMKVGWFRNPRGNIIGPNQGDRDEIQPPPFDASLNKVD